MLLLSQLLRSALGAQSSHGGYVNKGMGTNEALLVDLETLPDFQNNLLKCLTE